MYARNSRWLIGSVGGLVVEVCVVEGKTAEEVVSIEGIFEPCTSLSISDIPSPNSNVLF